MKKILLLICVVFFSGCAPVAYEKIEWSKSAFAFVDDGGGFYFEYPLGASLGEGFFVYQNCRVNYLKGALEYERVADKAKGNASVWYEDFGVRRYVVQSPLDYVFYLEGAEDQAGCIGLVERVAGSFGEKRVYTNERYGFSLILPEGFELNYLGEDQGMILSRGAEDFAVNIVVAPFLNVDGYDGLDDLVIDRYFGYTSRFVDYSGFSGVYVDEFVEGKARRHFFAMLGRDVVFSAYLEVLATRFSEFESDFEMIIEGMRI